MGGKHVYSGNQVRKEGGNQYLDMVSAIESEVAELHSSTATMILILLELFTVPNLSIGQRISISGYIS